MQNKNEKTKMQGFVKMSKYAGMREDLVQAGGGNSAVKLQKDKMVIKASGFQLADIDEETGYAVVNHAVIRDAFLGCGIRPEMTDEESERILSDAFIEGGRPSIETFLHSVSGVCSLHTHPIIVNAIACREDGKMIFEELFPEALVVPYATPGVELSRVYFDSYKEYKKTHRGEPVIVFLMNHGLLVSAETADEVIGLTEHVTKKLEKYLHVDFNSYHLISEVANLYSDGIVWRVSDANIITSYKKIGNIWKHYFCPDCVVFLGRQIYIARGNSIDQEDYDSFVEKNGYPVVIAFGENLYIHADSVKKALEIQSVLSFSAQVMALNIGKECCFLSEEEKSFLLNWDSEKYRRDMR